MTKQSQRKESTYLLFSSQTTDSLKYSVHIFCSSSNHFLKRERGKNGANLKLFKNHFQNGVLFKYQIIFRKTPAGDVQIQEEKRKRISIGCGRQTSKYLTDKIRYQTYNSHVNIVF